MPTGTDELQYSTVTRIAGQSEEAALDVLPECGLNRAAVSSVERASSFRTALVSVAQVAVLLRAGDSDLLNRRVIAFRNNGPQTIFIGNSSGVTTSSGFPVTLGETVRFKLSEVQNVWAISAAGTQGVSVLEVSGV